MNIDKQYFFDNYRNYYGKVTQAQAFYLDLILSELDKSELISGENWIVVLCKYAYVLATIKHETADTFAPISERGGLAYLRKKPYYPYYGRGLVQLTWFSNYKKYSDILKIDLVSNPDKVKEFPIAWKITEHGMTYGTFTGKKLSDYFYEGVRINEQLFIGHRNYLGYLKTPRRIINGTDRYESIGKLAWKIYCCLKLK